MRDEDECSLDLLGADDLVGKSKSAEQKRYEEEKRQYKEDTDRYNAALTTFWNKSSNPTGPTDAEIARFQQPWRVLLSKSPPVAPVALAAKGCAANGMTLWHWLFLLLLLICALVMPHVIAYLRSRRVAAIMPVTPVEPQAQE